MKLIVGLGNPGIEYQFTPHNLGFLAVDRIAERHKARVGNRHCKALVGKARMNVEGATEEVILAKPETFMNLSGLSVRELMEEYESQPADVIVVYDELAFPLGTMRIRQRGSSGGHNGLESVIGALGTQEFVRLRLGIGPDKPVGKGGRYVLSQFKRSQLKQIDEVLDRAAEAVEMILSEGAAKAMNRFNQKAKEDAPDGPG